MGERDNKAALRTIHLRKSLNQSKDLYARNAFSMPPLLNSFSRFRWAQTDARGTQMRVVSARAELRLIPEVGVRST